MSLSVVESNAWAYSDEYISVYFTTNDKKYILRLINNIIEKYNRALMLPMPGTRPHAGTYCSVSDKGAAVERSNTEDL